MGQRIALTGVVLRPITPDNAMFEVTGRKFDGGDPERRIDVVYAEAHADAMTRMGYPPAGTPEVDVKP